MARAEGWSGCLHTFHPKVTPMVPPETLKHIQFLQDFSDDYLQQLAEMAEIKEFPADGVVFREGQLSPSVYLVVQGNLALEFNVPSRGDMQFQTLGAGELLGWTAVLGPGPMTATARVQTPSTLLVLTAAQIQALCARDPSFGSAFMHHLARALAARLSATRLLLMDLYREDQLPARQERIA
jgi:CRP/FNR family transcriptional regulator, cyclic AMP receptor protein